MARLRWQPMRAPMPGIQMWGAFEGFASFVISRDTGCKPDDRFYGRFAASAKLAGGRTLDLGVFDSIEEAKAAAEASNTTVR